MKTKVIAAVIALAAATQAKAAPFNADGVATGQSRTEIVEFEGGHVILNSHVDYATLEMEDPANPMNLLSGSCFGVVEIRGGAASGGGTFLSSTNPANNSARNELKGAITLR